MNWAEMTPRERDALVGQSLMGLTIARTDWPCERSPDCGRYEACLYDLERDPEARKKQYGTDEFDPNEWYTDQERGPIYVAYTMEGLEDWEWIREHELGVWCEPVPFYTTDIVAALKVEDEIANRTRQSAYCGHLFRIVISVLPHENYSWALVRATPEQRCLAALRTIGVDV